MGVVYFSIIPTFEPSRYCKCWIVCFYYTYVGNPFRNELVNIDDKDDMLNWTNESMHTLEGGRPAFYERKEIYESGS